MTDTLPLVQSGGSGERCDTQPGLLRVVTWNIELGERIDQAIAALTTLPGLVDADVVLLQEMGSEGTAQIADALGFDWVYASGGPHSKTGREFGNAVLSRWAIERAAVTPLPHQALIMGEFRFGLRASINLADTTLDAWSVHAEISTLPFRRQVAQYEAIARATEDSSADMKIVGGDFNTATTRNVRMLMHRMAAVGATFTSVEVGDTFERFGRAFKLDHLFNVGMYPESAGTTGLLDASDHAPVWARFMTFN